MTGRSSWPIVLVLLASASLTPRAQALDFTLPVAEGGHLRLAEERGRVVWLALVAPWCGQCIGFVAAANDRLADAASNELGSLPARVLVISAVDRAGRPLSVADVPVLVDRQGEVMRRLAPPELPWLVRIDEDGSPTMAGGDLDRLVPVAEETTGWLGRWGSLGGWFGDETEENSQ